MNKVLAFDVYGTLIDTQGVIVRLKELIGEKAPQFSQLWRDKQLEYSFRRGLMRQYESFAVCTRQSLDYTDLVLETQLNPDQKAALMAEYSHLPVFEDVKESLLELQSRDCKLYAFSNGKAEAVDELLTNAGVRELFKGVVSVHDQQSFKPNPDVYDHLLNVTGANAGDSWLISSNPFDVIGAISSGLNSAWVKRSNSAIFDPWGIDPTEIITHLGQLADAIENQR